MFQLLGINNVDSQIQGVTTWACICMTHNVDYPCIHVSHALYDDMGEHVCCSCKVLGMQIFNSSYDYMAVCIRCLLSVACVLHVSHTRYDYKGRVYVLALRYQGYRLSTGHIHSIAHGQGYVLADRYQGYRFSIQCMRYCVERCRKSTVFPINITPDIDSNILLSHLKVSNTAPFQTSCLRSTLPIVYDFTWNKVFSITNNVLNMHTPFLEQVSQYNNMAGKQKQQSHNYPRPHHWLSHRQFFSSPPNTP